METIQISKTDLASRDRKIDEQQRKIAELEAKMNNFSSGSGNGLGSEDREALGELSEPIQRMINSALSGVTTELNKNFETITSSIESLQSNISTQNQSLFSGVASSTLENYSEITNSADFKEFLEGRIKGVGVTWGDSWATAKKKNDMSTMKEIMDSFVETKQDASPTQQEEEVEKVEASQDAGANLEPSGAASTAKLNKSSKYKFKVSDYQRVLDEYKANKITIDEVEQFETRFEEAAQAGQVLDDSEIMHQ